MRELTTAIGIVLESAVGDEDEDTDAALQSYTHLHLAVVILFPTLFPQCWAFRRKDCDCHTFASGTKMCIAIVVQS